MISPEYEGEGHDMELSVRARVRTAFFEILVKSALEACEIMMVCRVRGTCETNPCFSSINADCKLIESTQMAAM